MKKLFGLLTALILAVVMIFPMGVFADAGGNTSNANGIPASATVYYGDVDWESNDLPDEFYVVKTEKFGNGMARIYREELRISYTLFKHYTGTKEISNEKYHTYAKSSKFITCVASQSTMPSKMPKGVHLLAAIPRRFTDSKCRPGRTA